MLLEQRGSLAGYGRFDLGLGALVVLVMLMILVHVLDASVLAAASLGGLMAALRDATQHGGFPVEQVVVFHAGDGGFAGLRVKWSCGLIVLLLIEQVLRRHDLREATRAGIIELSTPGVRHRHRPARELSTPRIGHFTKRHTMSRGQRPIVFSPSAITCSPTEHSFVVLGRLHIRRIPSLSTISLLLNEKASHF